MSRKIAICTKCGEEKILVRGFCANKCYSKLIRNGSLKIKKIIDLPKNLSLIQKEIITGLLLGDGCLFKNFGSKNKKLNLNAKPMLSIVRQIRDIEYLRYNFSFLKDFCSYNDVKESKVFDKRTNKFYFNCKFSTRSFLGFEEFYKKWYPNGKKIVPKDLELTPLICAIWFCDDGCISIKNNRLRLKLSTHGFPRENTIWLAEKLSNMFNENFSIGTDDGNSFIITSDSGSKAFVRYIENSLHKSMDRKITWSQKNFDLSRSRPQSKARLDKDLNDKEISILKILNENDFISSLEICKKINWIVIKRTPSAFNRYLNKFLLKKWIIPFKLKRNSIKYRISDSGKKILDEAISFNTENSYK